MPYFREVFWLKGLNDPRARGLLEWSIIFEKVSARCITADGYGCPLPTTLRRENG